MREHARQAVIIDPYGDVREVMVGKPSSAEDDAAGVFEEFFRENYSNLWRYVARRVPRSTVDDVVSRSFVVAWKKLATIDVPSLPWLIRIASFEVSNERRKQRREGLRVEAKVPEDMAGPLDEAFDGSLVRSAIATLSEADQEILRLVLWDELPRDEIAAVLGMSTNAVNVRFHRALRSFERSMVISPHDYPAKDGPHGH